MGGVVPLLLSPALALASKAMKPKPQPAPPMVQPTAQPPRSTVLMDEVARRRGSRANQRTGAAGAEPGMPGTKTQLGA